MKKSILFFAALAALFSCSKENPVDNYNPADDTYSVTLTASAPGADTKTTLVDGVDNKGMPIKFVHWSKGDAIKVLFFPGRHGNVITGPSGEFVSHFVEDASASANFRIDKWSFGMDQSLADDRLYSKGIAVYPSSANASSTKASGSYTNNVSDVSFTLPSEQNAVENNIESNLNFSYADVDLASFTNTINNPSYQTKLTFNNTCALIQLTMPAELPKVTQIAITSNDKVALTGHGSMNYTTSYNQEVNGTVTVTDGKNVVLKCTEGFKAGATYYAVVWPGVHNSGLTIEFAAEDGTFATKTTSRVTLTASKVKSYTFNKGLDFESGEILPYPGDFVYDDGTWSRDRLSGKTLVGLVCYCGDLSSDVELMKNNASYNSIVVGLKDQSYTIVFCNGTGSDFYKKELGNNMISGNPSSAICGYTLYYPWIKNWNWQAVNGEGSNYANWTFIGPLLSDLDVPTGATQWYVPSVGEYKAIAALQGFDNLPSDYTKISGAYLTMYIESGTEYVYTYNIGSAGFGKMLALPSYTTRRVRPIFAIELNKDNFRE